MNNHNVCARQWQRYFPWVIEMFLPVRYPEASSKGSTSVMIWCIPTSSSKVGISVGNAPLAEFQKKEGE